MNFISSKINISRIIKSHMSTLKIKNKLNKADVWTFCVIPGIISLFLSLIINITDSSGKLLGVILSIFIGLFLNLLMLLISYTPPNDIEEEKKNALVTTKKESFYNVSYIILVCTLELFLLLIFTYIQNITIISDIFSFFIFFLSIHIFLLLLMILKRIFALYDNKI